MMQKPLLKSFLGITFLFIFFSCQQAEIKSSSMVVARVGNSYLNEDDLNNLVPEAVGEDHKAVIKEQIRDNWIKRQLLLQEAKRIGLSSQPDVLNKMQNAKDDILAQAMRDFWLSKIDSLAVTKVEAQSFYEKNKAQFVLQERYVRFRHIQTADLETCRNAKTELLRGVSFNKVVEKYALDKISTLANAEIFQPISVALSNQPDLNRYLQVIGINEISPIRFLDGRYHIVQLVEDKAAGEHPNLDWILDRITDWLVLEKKRKLIQSLERELYLKAEVSNEISLYSQQ